MIHLLECSFEHVEDVEKLIMLAGRLDYKITSDNRVVYGFGIEEERNKFCGKLYHSIRSNLNAFKGRIFFEPKAGKLQEENVPIIQS